MSIEFDQLKEMVKGYWPGYKANIFPIWDARLRHKDYDEVKAVLANHLANNPDEGKPIWKSVFRDLGEGYQQEGTLLSSIIAGVRADRRKAGSKAVENWTDADCFDNYLRSQTYCIVYTLDGKLRDDPDGRRARNAAYEREAATYRVLSDLKSKGQNVPDWLEQMVA